ncbi:MAG TPA: DUF3562 domain-containing protein [Burkholderiaceae bacterium]|jgi:hypothetical protein|nr:DUF3562 domain-containing protein [Burkholderiaceae bacterium]
MNTSNHTHRMPSPAISALPASPYSNPEERSRHLRIIGRLATEVHRTVDEIEPLYEDIFAHLKNTARVVDYLPILVSRRVKELLM